MSYLMDRETSERLMPPDVMHMSKLKLFTAHEPKLEHANFYSQELLR